MATKKLIFFYFIYKKYIYYGNEKTTNGVKTAN